MAALQQPSGPPQEVRPLPDTCVTPFLSWLRCLPPFLAASCLHCGLNSCRAPGNARKVVAHALADLESRQPGNLQSRAKAMQENRTGLGQTR